MHSPLVIKLGGSLAESGRIAIILDLLAHARVPLVVVPGGGPFADAVRAIQPQLGLTDQTAHRLALLAMHQMGLVMAAHAPRFTTAETLDAIAYAHKIGAIPVWLPFALQHHDPSIPADWTATSDSMAARLAERMGGAAVALVKSCLIEPEATLTRLTASGIVDPVFASIVTRAHLPWQIYGAGDESRLAERLQ